MNGLKPLEPVVEFVNKNHQHFTGGIFFVSTKNSHYITQAEDMIKEVIITINNSPIYCMQRVTTLIFSFSLPDINCYTVVTQLVYCYCRS